MNSKLRIVFMGTPEFAVASLDKLISDGFEIVGVITSPDKPAGRGQKTHQSAVKVYAELHGLKTLQPTNLKDPEFLKELKLLNANLQIVVAFRMLPELVWNMPEHGTYNLHGSLLPKYRGAAPINWSIINGDKQTGVTTFKLTHQIDTGNILFQAKQDILPDMNAGNLHDALMKLGADLISKTVYTIDESIKENKELQFVTQNDSLATHAPKLFKDTCKVDWSKPSIEVYNFIRGLSPYPAAYSTYIDKDKGEVMIILFVTELLDENVAALPGQLITDNKTTITIQCGSGSLLIKELQLQGKKRMNVKEFLNGFKLMQPLTLT